MNWIVHNKAWLFSGIAVAIPLAIIGWILGSKKNKQIQKSGKNSTNIQVGGNITIEQKKQDE